LEEDDLFGGRVFPDFDLAVGAAGEGEVGVDGVAESGLANAREAVEDDGARGGVREVELGHYFFDADVQADCGCGGAET